MVPPATNSLPRPRLSVALIVRDEADVLSATLGSLWPIADEIVVLDTGSTDGTLAAARRLHAVVDQMPWGNDFAAARNRCVELATGDWVLWVDAGERLDPGTANQLRAFLDKQARTDHAYRLMIEIPSLDPSASSEQAARLRLVPRRPELRFEGRVRETLRPAVEAAGMTIDMAPGRLVRHPRQHDPARRAQRAQRDLDLITQQAAEQQGYSHALLLALGEAQSDLGNADAARRAFLQVLSAAPRGSTAMLEAYYGLITSLDGESDRHLQLSTCLEALEVFPLDGQLLLAMGNYLQSEDRLDLAARSFEAALKHGQVNLETWHLRELGEVSAVCLGLTLQALGHTEEACTALRDGMKRYPGSVRLRRRLIDLLVRLGHSVEAVDLAENLPMEAMRRPAFRDAVLGASCAARQEWPRALGYLQSAYVAGCRDALCLRWLVVTLLSNGHRQAAEPVLMEWGRLEPKNPEIRAYLAAMQSKEAAGAVPDDAAAGPARRLRIDPAASIIAAPTPAPIVTQASSDD